MIPILLFIHSDHLSQYANSEKFDKISNERICVTTQITEGYYSSKINTQMSIKIKTIEKLLKL